MKGLLLTLLILSIIAFAADVDLAGVTISSSRPVDVNVSFDESTFNTQPWTKEFRYVIIVDKANTGKNVQTIKVYEYGQLIIQNKVSIVRDAFERKSEHGSKMDSWTVTPTGYYTSNFLDKDHKSSAYGGK